jgi:hypothetical protein
MKAVLEKVGLKYHVIRPKQRQELLPLQLQCMAVTAGRRRSQRSQRLKRRLVLRMMALNKSFIMAIAIVDEAVDAVVTSEVVDVVMGFAVGVAEVTEVMEANAVAVAAEDVEMAFVAETEEAVDETGWEEARQGPQRQAEMMGI